MTSSSRADLLHALSELGERYPHWRLGQLLENVAGWADANVRDAEDDALTNAIRTHFGQLREAEEPVAKIDR